MVKSPYLQTLKLHEKKTTYIFTAILEQNSEILINQSNDRLSQKKQNIYKDSIKFELKVVDNHKKEGHNTLGGLCPAKVCNNLYIYTWT